MIRSVTLLVGLFVFANVALSFFVTGCTTPTRPVAVAALPPKALPKPQPAAPAAVPPEVQKLKPNEVGRIPILMYHAVGAPAYYSGPRYDRRGLNIRPETFRTQLEMMYKAGWYPVNMRDALSAHIDVPAGKTPVVLTFDDARGSQFTYRKDGSIDPTCAIGILEAFHKEHPDWPERATFYVMGYSKWNPVPFYQPGKDKQKFEYLLQHGYEIANHTTSHRSMGPMNAQTIQWELAECVRYVHARVPNATMDTFALPYGIAPRNKKLWDVIMNGQQGGTSYHNRCILLAAGVPAYAPVDKKYDVKQIMRVGSEPGYIESWIKHLKRGGELMPYISDGDPNTVTIPKSKFSQVDIRHLDGARIVAWDDGSTAPKKPAQKAAEKKHGARAASGGRADG